ncbi:hypothetical protein Psch_02446 [Pelotomaculum schinkii]|uniref:Uncharacterized protein n=1 Tax=Pelotomaculum schinkii TaxID=78350 RepID=A0A4Y7R8W7_9FIRM|nr:hypothetical protein [Pelotomaculum schinkii]TEB05405.1 hypothetical protein Psch_02446 [Pelotomaculum schinkii]
MLLELSGEHDHVLVFTTASDVQMENPGIPSVKMFMVEDGTVAAL